jgi:phospholipase C
MRSSRRNQAALKTSTSSLLVPWRNHIPIPACVQAGGIRRVLSDDMDHGYTDEQKAFNHALMDKFVEFAIAGSCTDKSLVMDYYDGNTVTAL